MLVLMSKRASVLIKPGRTNIVEVPAGRAVVGKVDLGGEESLTNVHLPIIRLSLKQQGPEFPFPNPEASLSEVAQVERLKEHRKRVLDYWLSEEGNARRRKEIVFEIPSEQDGAFRIENVVAGDYELVLNAQKWNGKAGSEMGRQLSVPAESGGAPLDLGIVK